MINLNHANQGMKGLKYAENFSNVFTGPDRFYDGNQARYHRWVQCLP